MTGLSTTRLARVAWSCSRWTTWAWTRWTGPSWRRPVLPLRRRPGRPQHPRRLRGRGARDGRGRLRAVLAAAGDAHADPPGPGGDAAGLAAPRACPCRPRPDGSPADPVVAPKAPSRSVYALELTRRAASAGARPDLVTSNATSPTTTSPESASPRCRRRGTRDAARLLVALGPDGAATGGWPTCPTCLAPGDVRGRQQLARRARPAGPAQSTAGGGRGAAPGAACRGGRAASQALVRPGRRLPPGTVLYAGGHPVVEVGERLDDGSREVQSLVDDLGAFGAVALPALHPPPAG